MSEPILNFVACPWCTSGNAADMWHWGKCPGAAERDRRARDAVAEMFAALDAPVATATADQLRRKLLECEEALRTTEARAEKAEAERDALAAEVDRLRGVVDRCPADDTPLLHDDDNPQLKWWCPECGLITDRPSLVEEAPDA